MKKQMIIQALFAMMLGFAVPGFGAANDGQTPEQIMQELAAKNMEEDGFDLAAHRQAVEAIAEGTEGRADCLVAIKAREAVVAMQALALVNMEEDGFDLVAHKQAVEAIAEDTEGRQALLQVIAAREKVVAEVEALNGADKVKAFMIEGDKQTVEYATLLEAHLNVAANKAIKDACVAEVVTYKRAVFDALMGKNYDTQNKKQAMDWDKFPAVLKTAENIAVLQADPGFTSAQKVSFVLPPLASTGMSNGTKATIGVVVVALGYELFGRLLPKMNQLKRRQKDDENLQGKNMFVEAMREEYKAAKRGLNRGYEGLKGFFADEDEDDQDEEDQVQA